MSQQAMRNENLSKAHCCKNAPIVITIHGSAQNMTHEEVVRMPAEQFDALWKVRQTWLYHLVMWPVLLCYRIDPVCSCNLLA